MNNYIKNKLRYIKRSFLGAPSKLDKSDPPNELEFINKYLENNDVVFDVGANIGIWSYFLSKSNHKIDIYSFEPNPNVSKMLEANTKNIRNITIEKFGIGNDDTKADFYIHPSHGRSSFGYTNEYSGCKVISVPVTSLDSYLKKNVNIFPSLIKVDVEGFEPEVWEGMQSLLVLQRPKILVFELEDRHLLPRGHSARSLAKKIVNAGYYCYVYRADLNKMTVINVDEFDFPKDKPLTNYKFSNNFVFVNNKLADLPRI